MGHGDPGIGALDLDVGHQRAAFRPGGFRVDAAGRAQIGDVGGAEMLGLVRQARRDLGVVGDQVQAADPVIGAGAASRRHEPTSHGLTLCVGGDPIRTTRDQP